MASLGDSKRPREPNLEAPSAPRRQFGGPKVVLELNLEVHEPSEGFPMASQELFRTSWTLKNHAPMQARA